MHSPIPNLLVVLAILAAPFSDTMLQQTMLGVLGMSPAALFIGLHLLFGSTPISICGQWHKSWHHILLAYAILVSLYGGLIYGDYGLGADTWLIQGLKITILNLIFIYPMLFFSYTDQKVRTSILIAFVVAMIGILWVDLSEMDIWHMHPNLNGRLRGFTVESSHLSAMIIPLAMAAAYVARIELQRVFILIFAVVAVLLSESKGGQAALIASLCAGLVAVLRTKRLAADFSKRFLLYRGALFSILIVIVVLARVSLPIIQQQDNVKEQDGAQDICNYTCQSTMFTSVGTRVVMAVTSVRGLLEHPFGVGPIGYTPYLLSEIPDSIEFITSNLTIKLNFSEVLGYHQSGSPTNVSTKSLLFDGIILFGIPFLLGYLIIFGYLIVILYRRNQHYLLIGICYAGMALAFYSTGIGLYAISICLGLAIQESYRKDESISCDARLSVSA